MPVLDGVLEAGAANAMRTEAVWGLSIGISWVLAMSWWAGRVIA